MSAQPPKVSVLMVTYNHERYISQAIESVLMQQTDFPIELVIGEDCSTDRTREIVLDVLRRYPNKIRPVLPERNLGMHRNFVQTWRACQGPYIALLEGDDYWISPDKLQRQVDFLDAHPDYVMCYHPVTVVNDDPSPEGFTFPGKPERDTLTIEDLIHGNPIQTCSVMYRGGLVKNIPAWMYRISMIDWPLHLLHARYGKVKYLDNIDGAYRVHRGGVLSTRNPMWLAHEGVRSREYIYRHFQYKYVGATKYDISRQYLWLAMTYKNNNDIKSFAKCVFRSLMYVPLRPYLIKSWLLVFLKDTLPGVYRYVSSRRLSS